MNIKRYQVILAFIAFIALAGIVGQSDFEEELRQVQHYCDMVKMHEQTNGQAGWPAYNGKGMCQ